MITVILLARLQNLSISRGLGSHTSTHTFGNTHSHPSSCLLFRHIGPISVSAPNQAGGQVGQAAAPLDHAAQLDAEPVAG